MLFQDRLPLYFNEIGAVEAEKKRKGKKIK
jgi:hypothetical protein